MSLENVEILLINEVRRVCDSVERVLCQTNRNTKNETHLKHYEFKRTILTYKH